MNNLDLMKKRLQWQGGIPQENRMIKDKFRTLQRALKYSYQACTVAIVQPFDQILLEKDNIDSAMTVAKPERALINPDKLKQDYDDKIISIPYEANFHPGDVFEWKKTDTFWLVSLQELTEDAYFRADIRRCRNKIKFIDENGIWCSTWAAVRGPVETQIDSIQKNQIRIDRPNWSLNILMPLNEKTKAAFNRYKEFMYDGLVWRVTAVDAISMKNVLEVNAVEYYIDKDTDDVVEQMKNGLVIETPDPTPNSGIEGPTFIKPKITEEYFVAEPQGVWCIKENFPVSIESVDDYRIRLTWQKSVSGQFTLQWSKDDTVLTKVIVVESLF